MNVLDKYKKYVESKETGNEEGTSSYAKYAYYNPSKHIEEYGKPFKKGNTSVNRVIVRVLPNAVKNDYFFYEFKKHRYKVGATTKSAFCLYSINPTTGDKIHNKCPFCDFLDENRESISKEIFKAMAPKEFQMMLVYVYDKDEIQKYETNYYANTKIMPLVIKLIESGVNIEEEGFDIVFEREGKNWPEIFDVREAKVPLESIFSNSVNYNEIPSLYEIAVPAYSDVFYKSIESTFEYGVKALCPTFAAAYTKTAGDANVSAVENYDQSMHTQYVYDPNEDNNDIPTVTATDGKATTMLYDNDENLADIQDFVSQLQQSRAKKDTDDEFDLPF